MSAGEIVLWPVMLRHRLVCPTLLSRSTEWLRNHEESLARLRASRLATWCTRYTLTWFYCRRNAFRYADIICVLKGATRCLYHRTSQECTIQASDLQDSRFRRTPCEADERISEVILGNEDPGGMSVGHVPLP